MNLYKTHIRLIIVTLSSILSVVLLFNLSETEVHTNNAFIRRFPHHPVSKKYDLPINYNSYYIAGYHNDTLFLGNTTAPLHLLSINLKTKKITEVQIEIEHSNLPFYKVSVKIVYPYFFVMDGTLPHIFRGNVQNWKAKSWSKGEAYFSNAIPIDSNKLWIKATSAKTNESILGLLGKEDSIRLNLHPELLEKQIDGVFDVDGQMVVSQNLKALGYVYYYRNQFLVMNSDLKMLLRNSTIDTVTLANIQISDRSNKVMVQMKAPPMQINQSSAIKGDLMLINSDRLGKYEEAEMRNQAAIIDVYNWTRNSYEFSFYIYNIENKKMREFNVYDEYLIALIGNSISVYELKKSSFSKFYEAKKL